LVPCTSTGSIATPQEYATFYRNRYAADVLAALWRITDLWNDKLVIRGATLKRKFSGCLRCREERRPRQ
jgi:hypothetical protein